MAESDERREAARIPLRGRGAPVRDYALVDAEDFEWLSRWNWYLSNGYVGRTVRKDGKQRTITMHRMILSLEAPGGGRRDSRHGDHINGNKLDNRRSNLRVADWELNSQNMRPTARNKSGYLCVFKAKGRNKTPEEAADAVAAFRAEHMPYSVEAREAA